MKNGILLIEYLARKKGSKEEVWKEFEKYHVIRYQLEFLLNNCLVIDVREPHLKSHIDSIPICDHYGDVIDKVIKYLGTLKGNRNCLSYGYVDPSDNGAWGANGPFNPHSSFQVNQVKSSVWEAVYHIMGRNGFLELIFGTRTFVRTNDAVDGFMQVFGSDKQGKFFNRRFQLSRNTPDYFYDPQVIPSSKDKFFQEVVGWDIPDSLPKRFRRLKGICSFIYTQSINCPYTIIYKQIMNYETETRDVQGKVDESNIGDVIRFVLVIIGKIFPINVWGSQENKSIITKYTIKYIFNGIQTLPPKLYQLPGLKIKLISWLSKNSSITSTQDFRMRQEVLATFLQWYFVTFLRRLLTKFWHLVKSSNYYKKNSIEYYPKTRWNNESKQFLSNYINTYLYEVPEEFLQTSNLKNNFVGSVRLIPKATGFRLLCIPLKQHPFAIKPNTREDITKHLIMIKHSIRPLQALLSYKDRQLTKERGELSPRCYSVTDIARHINEFRIKKLKTNDKFFMLQFDMQHCYDNIDHQELFKCIDRLFKHDSEDKTYYIRQYIEVLLVEDKKRTKLQVLESDKLDMVNSSELAPNTKLKALIDQCTTYKLTRNIVNERINDYINNSILTISIGSVALYKRHKGVFQGFPLLATLCNIFYNQLVDNVLSEVLQKQKDSLLLRLADDFLFISTNKESCQELYSYVCGDKFKSVGAIVNENKTCWINGGELSQQDTFKFVGLNINAKDLTVNHQCMTDPSGISNQRCVSYKELYGFLTNWLNGKLKENVIGLQFGTLEAQLANMERIIERFLDLLCRGLNDDKLSKSQEVNELELKVFIMDILKILLTRWTYINKSEQYNDYIIGKYKECVGVKGESNIYLGLIYSELEQL